MRRQAPRNEREESTMKQHKFWAYAMIFCAIMAVYTGRKHA